MPNQDATVALWLSIALFCFYLLTAPAHRPYGDEETYLAVAKKALMRGDRSIARIEPDAAGQLRDVVTHSKFAIGQSLLLLPFAAAELVLA